MSQLANNLSKYWFYMIIPALYLGVIIWGILFILMPYIQISVALPVNRELRMSKEASLNEKLAILKNARERKSELVRYKSVVEKLIPEKVVPLEYTTKIKNYAFENLFYEINENRNLEARVSSNETPTLETEGINEFIVFEEEKRPFEGTEVMQNMILRFNGKTVGQLAAVNFFKNFSKGSDFLATISGVDYFNDFENGYLRVSFNLSTPYMKEVIPTGAEAPLEDIFANEDFFKFMQLYQKD